MGDTYFCVTGTAVLDDPAMAELLTRPTALSLDFEDSAARPAPSRDRLDTGHTDRVVCYPAAGGGWVLAADWSEDFICSSFAGDLVRAGQAGRMHAFFTIDGSEREPGRTVVHIDTDAGISRYGYSSCATEPTGVRAVTVQAVRHDQPVVAAILSDLHTPLTPSGPTVPVVGAVGGMLDFPACDDDSHDRCARTASYDPSLEPGRPAIDPDWTGRVVALAGTLRPEQLWAATRAFDFDEHDERPWSRPAVLDAWFDQFPADIDAHHRLVVSFWMDMAVDRHLLLAVRPVEHHGRLVLAVADDVDLPRFGMSPLPDSIPRDQDSLATFLQVLGQLDPYAPDSTHAAEELFHRLSA